MKNRDITFVTKDGVSKGVVNILGKVTTITHKTVQTFEDTVEVEQPAELLEKTLDRQSVYWKALPLHARPLPAGYCHQGREQSGPRGHLRARHRGSHLSTTKSWATSSLILADEMNTVSSREIGSGNFIIGNTFIRPRVSANPATPVSFKRSQQLNFWMQVYNLGIDEATKSNQATVTYQIIGCRNGDGDSGKATGFKGLGGAQRPVDGGENAPHGRAAARQVQGDDQNK